MGVVDPYKYTPPHMCHPAEFRHSRLNGTSVNKEIRLKNLTMEPFKVTQGYGTDMYRSATYDFLSYY